MDAEFDPKLESLIDAEMKKLPPTNAPASLAPRVMALLAARARQPWWQRSWWDWPLAAKAAFLLLALGIVSAFSGGGVMLDQGIATYSQEMSERLAPVTGRLDTARTLFGALGLLWDKAAQPFVVYGLLVAGVLYLICVGLGTACVRHALKRF